MLLAAGSSTRMGRPKQLLDFGGTPLVRRSAETALAVGSGPVAVVCGAAAPAVLDALAGMDVYPVVNERWREGMGTSIQTGLRAVEEFDLDGVILSLGDLPLISKAIYERLIAAHHETGKPIVAAAYAGTVGVPVLFTKVYFPALLALEPGQGCKGVIVSNSGDALRLDCPEAETDVDTPEDYARALRLLAAPG